MKSASEPGSLLVVWNFAESKTETLIGGISGIIILTFSQVRSREWDMGTDTEAERSKPERYMIKQLQN